MAEAALHVALAALTLLGWLGAGTILLAPFPRAGDDSLDALNRAGVGAVAFSLATFAAGWAGLLDAWAYRAVLAAAAVVGILAVARLRMFRLVGLRRRAWWERALVAAIAVEVALAVVVTCAPISSADALYYHAAAPAAYEQAGAITETPASWHTYQPFGVEMLVLDGMLLHDEVQGAFAPLILALLTLAAVAGAAARLAGRRVAVLATAILALQGFWIWEATSTFVEPGLAFAATLAAWNLSRAFGDGRLWDAALAGLFAGAAAGMKYVGVLVALLVAAAALAAPVGRTRIAAVVTGVAALVAAPWYVKNLILTGNPVYPFVFGGMNADAETELERVLAGYGHGRTAGDALLLPFRLLGDADDFDRGEFMSPLFLAFAPAALLRTRCRGAAALVLGLSAAYVCAWFLTSQQARFLLPLMPVLAILAGLGATTLAAGSRVGRAVTVAAVAGALAVGVAVSVVYAGPFLPVVAGRESEQEFLSETSFYYDGAQWLNEHLDEDDRVLVDLPNLLYVDVPYVLWSPDLLSRDAGAEETRSVFERERVTHVAILAADGRRRRQVAALDVRLVARVTVRDVESRTLGRLGPPEHLLVYARSPGTGAVTP